MFDFIQRSHAASRAKTQENFIPWRDDQPWDWWLPIRSETYKAPNLFPDLPARPLTREYARSEDLKNCRLSPKGTFCYRNNLLPARTPLGVYKNRGDGRECSKGYAFFDAPTLVPAIYEKDRTGKDYERDPWMSFTPNELITLRPGVRYAKGSVIVAGLGLGWQLVRVSQRKQVKALTLVEISQELVDWIMPIIQPQLGCKVDVVVGDAWELLPKMSADICLMDIFPRFGGNSEDVRYRLGGKCPGIKRWWIWG